ncbi:hypothetical protein B0H11DRAFT_2225383 [Mycena galericulata]|nr:hypothetical protein B0H11DRAFT_2225383 [Mycena galericulata]
MERPLPAEQPPTCYLFKLPAELRLCIYEHALAGRIIHLALEVASEQNDKPRAVRAAYYELAADTSHTHSITLDVPAEPISAALLLSCRRVYLEALPTLHTRNTCYFSGGEFAEVIAALGDAGLPCIRSVYLNCEFRGSALAPWRTTLPLLEQMTHLHSLVFEFPNCHRFVEEDEVWADGMWAKNVGRFTVLSRSRIGIPASGLSLSICRYPGPNGLNLRPINVQRNQERLRHIR